MSNNNNAIPSPEEWLKKQVSPHMRECMEHGLEPVLFYQDVYRALAFYAAHVAALVHRNTRHRAAEIIEENYQSETEIGDYRQEEYLLSGGDPSLSKLIMNIPLRAVYPAPAGEENRE